MKIALLTNVVSPHQLPLARAIVGLVGKKNYRYIYTEDFHAERAKMGWQDEDAQDWCRKGTFVSPELLEADVLISGHRALDLFENRNRMGKKTFYASERWFKPRLGFLRMVVPSYFKMARRFVRCLRNENFRLLPMGIHAARDFARLMGLFNGDLRCLFRAPKVTFESKPGGKIWVDGKLSDKMNMWGYFVAPSTWTQKGSRDAAETAENSIRPIRVLWVGRMLDWKRVDTLVRACKNLSDVELSLYGKGPMEARLKKMAKGCGNIRFHDFVPIDQVRELMHEHDVYVLASNASEGWGAALNEALEEGMRVLGTLEAGSSATILPPDHLFHSGDVPQLRKLFLSVIEPCAGFQWTAQEAAVWITKGF